MSWHGQKRIESAPRWPDERPAVCDDRWQGPLSRADEVTRTIRGDARFDRKADAVAWEQDQTRRLRLSEWVDSRRGHVPLSTVATSWLASRSTVKRSTQESDEAAWGNHIEPRFGNWPVGSITTAEVSSWVGGLVAKGLALATATRALAVLRSLLNYVVADGRVTTNVVASVKASSVGRTRSNGHALTVPQLRQLAEECTGLMPNSCSCSVSPACAGASWRACTWATSCTCQVEAFDCNEPCSPAAAVVSCTSTRSRASAPVLCH
jgi:hypothetical protein